MLMDSWSPCRRRISRHYRTHGTQVRQDLWIEYGALEVHECVADDVKPGKLTSFPQAVKAKPDELVIFSWIVYKSRRHRDAVNKKVMADPRMKDMDPKKMPFDAKRMFWGGFKEIVSLSA